MSTRSLEIGDTLHNVGRDYVPTFNYGARITVVKVAARYAIVQDRYGANGKVYR